MKKLVYLFLFLTIVSCSVTKNTKTIHPFSGDAIGCGNFIAYKLTDDNSEYVSVKVDVPTIELQKKQMYGVGIADAITIVRKKYDGPINAALCNDLIPSTFPKELVNETATEGLLELILSESEIEKAKNKEPYKATLILKNVVFETVTIDYLRLEDISVGWFPG